MGRQVTAIISGSGEPLRDLRPPYYGWSDWSRAGSCDTPHTPDSLNTDTSGSGSGDPSLLSFSVSQLLKRGVVGDGCVLSPEMILKHSSAFETRPYGKYLNSSPSFYSQDDVEDFQTSPIFGKISEENTDDSSICSVPSNLRHDEASKENIDFSNKTYHQEKGKISVEAKIEIDQISHLGGPLLCYEARDKSLPARTDSSLRNISSSRSQEFAENLSLNYILSNSGKS